VPDFGLAAFFDEIASTKKKPHRCQEAKKKSNVANLLFVNFWHLFQTDVKKKGGIKVFSKINYLENALNYIYLKAASAYETGFLDLMKLDEGFNRIDGQEIIQVYLL